MSPPTLQHFRVADQPVLPWKNGGGTTREVAIAKHEHGAAFRWRVSVAQVASDGPFSLYPGIDRSLWLLRGKGMILDVEGVERRLAQRFERFDFPGENRITARLIDGPTEDLNLMVERASTRAVSRLFALPAGGAEVVRAESSSTGRDGEHLIVVLGGGLACFVGGEVVELQVGDALRWTNVVGDDVLLRAQGARVELLHASFVARSK
ncbi:MAG: HutD family protein [Planctomycetes bacterium]|nr:HutD family protein [Planctomycetota bacterium]